MKRAVWLVRAWGLVAVLSVGVCVGASPACGSSQESTETAASHHAAGMQHLQDGRLQEALAEFGKAVRLDRDHLPSLLQMADLLSLNGRVFEAYGILQHATSVAPESADAHSLLGRCLSRLGKRKEARAEFLRALEIKPDLPEPYYGLAAVELAQGRLPDARRHVETFLHKVPGDEPAKELLARICSEMKDYDAALAVYAELQNASPAPANIPKEIAHTLLAGGRYTEAEKSFEAVLERDPVDREALRGLFDASYGRGAYAKAIETMERIAKLEPGSCEPLLLLARAYHRLNQFALAHQRAQHCLQLEPYHAGAHFLMGWISFSEGDLTKAKSELEEAIKSDPSSTEALYWLGTVELRSGETAAALHHLEKAVSRDREHAGARYALAQVYLAEHRPTDAQKQFDEFHRLKGRDAWPAHVGGDDSQSASRAAPGGAATEKHLDDWIGFAKFLLNDNKPRDAIKILREAQKVAPESAEVSFLSAVGSTEIGETDTALAAYAEAEKRGPTAMLFLRRAALYRRLGENDRALIDLRQALSRELPARKAAEAHVVAGSILTERRHWGEAEPHLRQAIALDPDNSSAHLLLAEALLGLGRAPDAAVECRRNLEENPIDSPARLLLARALLEQRLDKDAADEINRASQFEGESGEVLLARGKLAAAQGLTQTAIDYLDRAGKTDPSLVEAFYFLGMWLLESRRRSDAAVAFEKATILDPLHAQSWLELGKIYLSAKRAEAAVHYFERATNAAPENAEAQYQLAIAFRDTGHLAEAKDAANRAKTLGHASAEGLLESLASRARP